MLKRKVEIVYEEFDEDYYFVTFLKENKNICIEFILCEFVEEMNHWDIFTQSAKKGSMNGFIFPKKVSKERINMEIERFIKRYKLDD